MSANVMPIKEFKEIIKMYIPFHEVSSPPRIGDVEGQSFECGCGESHIMNFEQHYFIFGQHDFMFEKLILDRSRKPLNTTKYH